MTEQKIGSSAEAVRRAYDIGNDFYSLWLDPEMVYSCAMWDAEDSLESAQLRKLDYHIESARAAGVRRALDIGCGWGGLLRRMVRRHGIERVVGLTLSEEQHSWVSRSKSDRANLAKDSNGPPVFERPRPVARAQRRGPA